MLGKVRLQRPAPGTVLGGLALIVAMSGVAVAAIPGGDGTVTACVSKDGAMKIIDAETGKTCQGTQTTVKLASTDATGKVRSADTLDGIDSTAFVRRVVTRYGPEVEHGGSYAACDSGEKVVGGGYRLLDQTDNTDFYVSNNRPSKVVYEPEAQGNVYYPPADGTEDATGWVVAIYNPAVGYRAYVQCAS